MIDPKQFYSNNDSPNKVMQRKMWNRISDTLFPVSNIKTVSFDRRSFIYGIAASFILMFTSIGIYSSAMMLIEKSQPKEIRTDKAYQTAIREFEKVINTSSVSSGSTSPNDLASLRKLKLQYLNEAIDRLKTETNSHDLSSLKRQRLHELYNMKLTVLQEMLQQGEIEL